MHTVCFGVFGFGLVTSIYQYRHYSGVTWASSCVKSPANPLFFFHPFVYAYIKENIKAVRYWTFGRRINEIVVDSPHKGSDYRNMSPRNDVIIDRVICWHWGNNSCDYPCWWSIPEEYGKYIFLNPSKIYKYNKTTKTRFKTTLSGFRSSDRQHFVKVNQDPVSI